jgi:hypothetical protein
VKPLPYLHLMPRVRRDFRRCLDFVARQPWGKPSDRESDIYLGIERARLGPELNRVGSRRRSSGIELRRCNAAQFVIVYAYLPPSTSFPHGIVSIRAIRHSRVRDVFSGVKESRESYGAP